MTVNMNTKRLTTVKQDIANFLLENNETVNPLIIAKATKRKLSSIRRELHNMTKSGQISVQTDEKGFYTSIKLTEQNQQEVLIPYTELQAEAQAKYDEYILADSENTSKELESPKYPWWVNLFKKLF